MTKSHTFITKYHDYLDKKTYDKISLLFEKSSYFITKYHDYFDKNMNPSIFIFYKKNYFSITCWTVDLVAGSLVNQKFSPHFSQTRKYQLTHNFAFMNILIKIHLFHSKQCRDSHWIKADKKIIVLSRLWHSDTWWLQLWHAYMFWVAGRRYNNFLSVNLSKGRQNVKKKVIWELFQGPSQYIPRGIWKWFEGPYSTF